jgi:hypothetical protein
MSAPMDFPTAVFSSGTPTTKVPDALLLILILTLVIIVVDSMGPVTAIVGDMGWGTGSASGCNHHAGTYFLFFHRKSCRLPFLLTNRETDLVLSC